MAKISHREAKAGLEHLRVGCILIRIYKYIYIYNVRERERERERERGATQGSELVRAQLNCYMHALYHQGLLSALSAPLEFWSVSPMF